MMTDYSVLFIGALAFGAVTAIVFVVGQFIATQARVQQRVGGAAVSSSSGAPGAELASSLNSLVSTYFDEKRFGVEGPARANLRRQLVRAGFLAPKR